MKTLPPSWVKNKQLSFADSLFNKPNKEDLFIEEFLRTLRNAKYLRYRIAYSNCKRGEKIASYVHWSDILEVGASILSEVAQKSTKFKSKTLEDFLYDVFIEKIDYAPTEIISRTELLQHHDNVTAKITGMFLAYSSILKKQKREMKVILENIQSSNINIHRLS